MSLVNRRAVSIYYTIPITYISEHGTLLRKSKMFDYIGIHSDNLNHENISKLIRVLR